MSFLGSDFNFIPAVIPTQVIVPDASAPLPVDVLPASIQEVFVVSRPNPAVSSFTAPPPPPQEYIPPPVSVFTDIIPVTTPLATAPAPVVQPGPAPAEYKSQPLVASEFNFVPAVIPNQVIVRDHSTAPITNVLPTSIQEVFLISRPNPSVSSFTEATPEPQEYIPPPITGYNDIIPVMTPLATEPAPIVQPGPPEARYRSQPLVTSAVTFVTKPYTVVNTPEDANQGSILSLQPLLTYSADQPLYASADDPGIQTSNWWQYPAQSSINVNGYNVANVSTMNISSILLDNVELTATYDDLLVNGVQLVNEPLLQSTMSNWSRYKAVTDVDFGQFNILSTLSIELDNVYLTATPNELLINGVPVVTSTALASLSSISDWAFYESLSTINMNNNGASNVGSLTGVSNVDGVKNLTFGTYAPFLGASISAVNDITFSYVTAALGQTGLTNVNNIAFWNCNSPGVPGFYVNLYSKNLSYNGGAASIYLATDTKLCVPALYTSAAPGNAGGKLEVLGANATTATVNGNPCSASWSLYPCTEPSVEMAYHQILNVSQIQWATNNAGPFCLVAIDNANGNLNFEHGIKVSDDINLNNNGLTTVRDIAFNGAGHLLATNGTGELTYNGEVIHAGGAGDVSQWANYAAVGNVVIPASYALGINAENTLTYYKDSHLNTNIYHGVEGNASCPDFISFPTIFQVGNTPFPAREITMTAGGEGFGINSDTEINIDATALVFVNCEGIVSISAETDLNLYGSITTFEFGEWNVTGLATTMELGSLDIVSAGNITLFGGLTTMTFGVTAINTGELNLLAAATTFEVASFDVASAGNVTTGGTQIGFTATTTFDVLALSNVNIVADDDVNITASNALYLSSAAFHLETTDDSFIKSRYLNVSTMEDFVVNAQSNVYLNTKNDITLNSARSIYLYCGTAGEPLGRGDLRIQACNVFYNLFSNFNLVALNKINITGFVNLFGGMIAQDFVQVPQMYLSTITEYPRGSLLGPKVLGNFYVAGSDDSGRGILTCGTVNTSTINAAASLNVPTINVTGDINCKTLNNDTVNTSTINTSSIACSAITALSGTIRNLTTTNESVTGTLKVDNVVPFTNTTVNVPAVTLSTVMIEAGYIAPSGTAGVYYNIAKRSLFFDATPFSIRVVVAPTTLALSLVLNEQAYVLAAAGTYNFTTAGLAGVGSGFYITLKNGLAPGGGNDIDIQENGAVVAGPTGGVLYANTATTNAAICYLLWNGTNLVLY